MENELARTQWRSSDGETARLDFCLWPVTSEDHVLILLLIWTNHLHYVFYWVSLGWFYLLDTHYGMLVIYLSFISPLCGVAQTPDCGMVTLAFSSRGVIQTLAWPSVFYFGISGGLPPDFSFISHALLSQCLSALVNLFICIMFTFVISYVRTVLRVLS